MGTSTVPSAMKTFFVALAFCSAQAFQAPAVFSKTAGSKISMAAKKAVAAPAAVDLNSLPGSLNPLPAWDPAGFCEGKTLEEVLLFREAEITHGRVCMLASLGFLYQYHSDPETFSGIATDYIATVPRLFWVALFTLAAPIEIYRGAQWSPLCRIGTVFFPLRDEYLPGDIGFDPLGIKPSDPEEFLIMQNREL